jgi:hypothetical protein
MPASVIPRELTGLYEGTGEVSKPGGVFGLAVRNSGLGRPRASSIQPNIYRTAMIEKLPSSWVE